MKISSLVKAGLRKESICGCMLGCLYRAICAHLRTSAYVLVLPCLIASIAATMRIHPKLRALTGKVSEEKLANNALGKKLLLLSEIFRNFQA